MQAELRRLKSAAGAAGARAADHAVQALRRAAFAFDTNARPQDRRYARRFERRRPLLRTVLQLLSRSVQQHNRRGLRLFFVRRNALRMRRNVGHEAFVIVPLRHAFEAKAALQKMLRVMNLNIFARRPAGAIAAKVPLIAIRQPAIDQQIFHATDSIKRTFFIASGKNPKSVNRNP